MPIHVDLAIYERMRAASANTARRRTGKKTLQAYLEDERVQETLRDTLRDLGAARQEGVVLSLAEIRRQTGFGDERVKAAASRLEAEGLLRVGPLTLAGRCYQLLGEEFEEDEDEF